MNDAIVQMAGVASIVDVEELRLAARQSETFRTALVRHEQTLLAQTQQSVACNASHRVGARLSRWLLRARDLSDGGARDRLSVSDAHGSWPEKQAHLGHAVRITRAGTKTLIIKNARFPGRLPLCPSLFAKWSSDRRLPFILGTDFIRIWHSPSTKQTQGHIRAPDNQRATLRARELPEINLCQSSGGGRAHKNAVGRVQLMRRGHPWSSLQRDGDIPAAFAD